MKKAYNILIDKLSELPSHLKGEVLSWDERIDDAILTAMKQYAIEVIDELIKREMFDINYEELIKKFKTELD